jgi:ABC-2 type transport system permease protein
MTRFIKLSSLSLQSSLYYRGAFLLNLLSPGILLAGQLCLWISLYGTNPNALFGGYTRADMLTYMLIGFCISNMFNWSSETEISRLVRSGEVVIRKIRPISFLEQSLADTVGRFIPQAVANIAISVLAFILFPNYFSIPSIGAIPLFLFSLALALILRILLVYCFGLLTFFTTSHLGIIWTRIAITDFFSGALIPIVLFPIWLQNVSFVLPFPFILQVPVAVLLGRPLAMPIWLTFFIQIAWIAFFFGLHTLLYDYIRKHATIAGG